MDTWLSLLESHPMYGLVGFGVLGLLVGSFLNVVILRLPLMMEWGWRREASDFLGLPEPTDPKPMGLVVQHSRCPHCQHALSWWENLPVISYVLLRGKCRSCKTPISCQYPFIEALTSLLFMGVWLTFGLSWMALAALVMVGLMVAAAGIDQRTTLLPDSLVYPLLWVGLMTAYFGWNPLVDLSGSVLGAFLGYMSLWSVYWLFKLLTGKEGMGHGDFKLLAALGAWLGASSLLPIVLVSTILGALAGGIAIAIQGRDKATPFPFGPFLVLGGWMELFWHGGLLAMVVAR